MNILRTFAVVIGTVFITSCATVPTTELRVMAASAAAPALNELASRFEQQTGHRLVIDYGILPVLKKKIDSGEAYDLVIVPNNLMNEALNKARIHAETRSPFARTGMAVAMKSGARKPDIRSVEAFKGAMLGAKSVVYPPEGLVGVHLAKVFKSLGITDPMNAKTKALKTVELVPQAISSGEAELGIAPSTVLVAGKGIDIVGMLPTELQSYVVLESAIGSGTNQSAAAKALMQYLTTPDAVGVITQKGFEVNTR